MDKYCEDCVHNEVCQYYAIPPHIGRCNDKDTLDDLRPKGEWIKGMDGNGWIVWTICKCSICNYVYKDPKGSFNFCPNCGADMRGYTELRTMVVETGI